MYADYVYDDERAKELHEQIKNHLREIDKCYTELRNLGYIVFKSEKENPDKTSD